MASLQDDDLPIAPVLDDEIPGEMSMFARKAAKARAAKAAAPAAVAPQSDTTTVDPVQPPTVAPASTSQPGPESTAPASADPAPATDIASMYAAYAPPAAAPVEASTDAPVAVAETPKPTGMDAILRAAMAARVVPGRAQTPRVEEASIESQVASEAPTHGETDVEAAPTLESEAEAEAEARRRREEEDLPEVDTSILDNVVYRGLENANEVFMALMKSGGLPDREAAQIWSDYLSYEKSAEKRDRIADISARERRILEDEAKLLKREAATSSTNGGPLSSLFGAMMSAPSRRRKAQAAESLAKAKEALANDKILSSNKFSDEQRLRIYETKSRAYNERMAQLFASSDDMAGVVRSYNDAFIDAPEAESFKKVATTWAAQSGVELPEVMREVADGRAPQAVMDEFFAVRDKVLANKDVIEAHKRILANEDSVKAGFADALKEGERMTRAFPDKFDHDKQFDGLTRAMDGTFQNTPKPMAEPAGQDMADRFKEMRENLQASFARMFEALASIFRR